MSRLLDDSLNKRWLLSVVILIVIVVSFLFSPSPQDHHQYHGKHIAIGNHLGFTINGDSWDYIDAASRPGVLLAPRHPRTARPLFVLAGSTIGFPIFSAGQLVNNLLPDSRKLTNHQVKYISYFLGFLCLNFLVLIAALWILSAIFRKSLKLSLVHHSALVIFCCATPVVKTFFWTPHQQMFYLFTPIFGIWLAAKITERGYRPYLMANLLAGILVLAYANFFLLVPVWVLAYAWFAKNVGNESLTKWLLRCGAGILLLLSPSLLWMLLIITVNGSYYLHEAEHFRQFVWLLDIFSMPFAEYANQFATNLTHFFNTLVAVGREFWLLWIAGIVALISVILPGQSKKITPFQSRITLLSLLTLFFTMLFFGLMGYYKPRLTVTIIPTLAVIIFAATNSFPKNLHKSSGVILLALSLVHFFILVTSYGPYS